MLLKTIKEDHAEMPDDKETFPRISLIIPFEPKMNKPCQLLDILTAAARKAEEELRSKYPEERIVPLIRKLHGLINEIHYESHGKSIAIFVSPVAGKVYQFTYNNSLQNYLSRTLSGSAGK